MHWTLFAARLIYSFSQIFYSIYKKIWLLYRSYYSLNYFPVINALISKLLTVKILNWMDCPFVGKFYWTDITCTHTSLYLFVCAKTKINHSFIYSLLIPITRKLKKHILIDKKIGIRIPWTIFLYELGGVNEYKNMLLFICSKF